MRFFFCGNLDCPEWVLAEIILLNRVGASKLKQITEQHIKKTLTGNQSEHDKLLKLCKDQSLNNEEIRVLLVVLEFVIDQAATHDISGAALTKDLLQLGLETDNAEAIEGIYSASKEPLVKHCAARTMRISQLDALQYKLSYIMSSS